MPWTPKSSDDPRIFLFEFDGVELEMTEFDGHFGGRVGGYHLESAVDDSKSYRSPEEAFEDASRIVYLMKRSKTKMSRGDFGKWTDLELARYVYDISQRGNAIEIVDYMRALDSNGSFDWNLMDPSDAKQTIGDHLDELLDEYSLTLEQVVNSPPVVQAGSADKILKKRLLR